MPHHNTVDDFTVPLARAAALETTGHFREAIDHLEAAALRNPDGRLEAELIDLRHRARTAVVKQDPANLPPPVTADPNPGPLGSVAPENLDVARLRSGLARGLIPPNRAAELAAGIDRALDQFDADDGGAAPAGGEPCWYRHFSPDSGSYRVGGRRSWVRATGALWTADSPHMLRELIATVEETGIGSLVTDYLGERPVLSANKAVAIGGIRVDQVTGPSTDSSRRAPRVPTSTGPSVTTSSSPRPGMRPSCAPSSAPATHCSSTTCSSTAPRSAPR